MFGISACELKHTMSQHHMKIKHSTLSSICKSTYKKLSCLKKRRKEREEEDNNRARGVLLKPITGTNVATFFRSQQDPV